jgi:pSer/pThr/pTyr-binding forkhead associated (FHA) protein
VHLVVPPGGSFREIRRIELDARVLTIGRAEGCDVRIDVPGVDDEHAKISEVSLTAVGPDCAVGDVPLDAGQRRLIAPGDEVQIGSVVLALDGADPEAVQGAPPRAGPRIRVVEGQNFGAELILAVENREYVIGRSPKADLVLEDREVSREHLKMVRRGFTVFIYDQASTRGSWLGRAAVYQGSRIEWERPRMLKVGATVLSLDLPAAARAAVPAAQPSAPMTAPPRAKKPPPNEASPATPAPPVPDAGPPPPGIVAYHYEAAKPAAAPSAEPAPIPPSVPPARPSGAPGPRTAWKKSGPTIGRASGLLLLAIAGLAILGALFVVFSLME